MKSPDCMKFALKICLFLFLPVFAFAQPANLLVRQTKAMRMEAPLKIDGQLDEEVWLTAPSAGEFVQNTPNPNAAPTQRTEVRVLYDNTALYIGAILYDTNPDSILNELTERDNLGNTDWFGVVIDTYRDGVNGMGFFTTPAGIQLDTKYSALSGGGGGPGGVAESGDSNWDAVWDAEARITSEGWVVEMKIPYSAIRFPDAAEQVWNVNFARHIRRNREVDYWNPIDPAINGFLNQSGQISGISDIKSPVRLSATPFLAVYGEHFYDQNGNPKSSWGRSIQGGMDIKYGLNDAFTLDMTLIPDFGQVQSDNQVLNLSPFEVRFDENRQFFTEGTELFNKGNLFYSRRVGGRPLHFFDIYDQVGDGEEILDNPSESQLLNATKVSGRTTSGLGIGVFNAVAGKTEATIQNTETLETRKVTTSPLTNYNVLAFDQNLKNNSYVSLVNTNVFRSGEDYEANATAVVFSLKNKAQSYVLDGQAALSQKYFPDNTDLGHTFFLGASKTSGKFQWSLGYGEESDTYDINDLGFLFNNNERNLNANINFNQYEPFGNFNRGGLGIWTGANWLYKPAKFTSYSFNFWGWAVTKNFFAFGMSNYTEPFQTYDYFEPRTDDFSRFYRNPKVANFSAWMSTDYRKKLAFDFRVRYLWTEDEGRYRTGFNFGPRLRVNDKLSFEWNLNTEIARKAEGWVTTDETSGDIIFGVRDNVSLTNLFRTTYTFSNKMSFSFRLRHYWSKAEYLDFGRLDENGDLAPTTYDEFSDRSFNSLTVDAVYRWRFAPGSDIFIVWKNNTSRFETDPGYVTYRYGESVNRLFGDIPTNNSLSVKVLYFLDYLSLKRR
ncbi:MAG: hypothetical protein D6714_14690 [Bacteroidetes bacterium]|nr:MAG: hypothetical protein D6714_14690 [Bacteroidota bacterium]